MSKILRAALVGYGNIARGYEKNLDYVNEFPITTHFKAAEGNDRILLDTVIDTQIDAIESAKKETSIKYTGLNPEEISNKDEIDILIISCPPMENKLDFIKSFPNLKGLILEKPIGKNLNQAIEINKYINEKNIKTQVAFLRRFDKYSIFLANGGLKDLIGAPQSAQIIYGNGIMNNGSHLLDLSRMLFGEFEDIFNSINSKITTSALDNDFNIACVLQTKSGINVSMLPIDFKFYRENSLDIWGTEGRIVFNQEGSYFTHWKVVKSRFGDIYKEIDWLKPENAGKTALGFAFEDMYSNLVKCIDSNKEVQSPVSSAIKTESILHKIISINET